MEENTNENENIEVNGRVYPLWQQFVHRKEEWKGGVLEDFGDLFDRRMGYKGAKTEITDIRLEPNGEDSAMFLINGKDFSCGFDVKYGGITAGEKGWLTFASSMGSTFRILNREHTGEKEGESNLWKI